MVNLGLWPYHYLAARATLLIVSVVDELAFQRAKATLWIFHRGFEELVHLAGEELVPSLNSIAAVTIHPRENAVTQPVFVRIRIVFPELSGCEFLTKFVEGRSKRSGPRSRI